MCVSPKPASSAAGSRSWSGITNAAAATTIRPIVSESPSLRSAPATRSVSGSPSCQIISPAVVPRVSSVSAEDSPRLPRGPISPTRRTTTIPVTSAMTGESAA